MSLALITGASRGIGRAIAVHLAQAGYDIVVNYRERVKDAEDVASEITALGRTAILAPFDVSNVEQTEAALEQIVERHGCPDALINNAGIARDALFPLMGREAWESVLATNLGSFFTVTRPILRKMIRRRSGRIVNLSSISGQRGNAGQVNYAASKAGLIGATKALALEVAPRNITVNAVAPGFIATDMTTSLPEDKILPLIPMNRLGTPADVAAAVAFLCSEGAAYITGHVLNVNGGLYT